jgi:NADP-dependent 3-hydroxy acid dehydrogenase YdfG
MKVALITGGNSGIGKATAVLFAQRGYQVAIAARRADALDQVKQELEQIQENVMAIAADVSISSEVDRMVNAVLSAWGQVDVLVHAAGVIHSGTVLETDEQTWDEIIDINFKGTFLANSSVLKPMIERGQGAIINVASDAKITCGRSSPSKDLPLPLKWQRQRIF